VVGGQAEIADLTIAQSFHPGFIIHIQRQIWRIRHGVEDPDINIIQNDGIFEGLIPLGLRQPLRPAAITTTSVRVKRAPMTSILFHLRVMVGF